MGLEDWVSLSPLKRAVKKIRFILNFNINRWRLARIISNTSRSRLSFNDRQGLHSFIDDHMEGDHRENESTSSIASTPQLQLQRTMSLHISSDEDIDDRAELFISNFYRQLQIERQISLELQYCRGNSMESTRSD
ncbi:hypothetical protein AQUCO_06800073v1 [Aquilegia coerulea]|uniref:Cotton fiber protein n=1 Tax=Aquilegia coerulea TaxID=218851 RepID=A0A2G5CCR8_AQUCA|nr:hypothetical protein AQUCO_06800073v1 [Aquilegia coerulea]